AAAENWRFYRQKVDGSEGVGGARASRALKDGNAPAAAVESGRMEARRGLGVNGTQPLPATLAAEPRMRVAQYSEQAQGKFVAGRNAFQNGNQWLDSEIQKRPEAKRVRIQFNSPKY